MLHKVNKINSHTERSRGALLEQPEASTTLSLTAPVTPSVVEVPVTPAVLDFAFFIFGQ